MKKFFRILAIGLIFVFAAMPLAACKPSVDPPEISSDIEVGDPEFYYISREEYDPETFDPANTDKWSNLAVDTEYLLFITFDVTARQNNDGQSLLHVNFTFDALDVLDGTMEDVSTGMMETMTFDDANTGKPGKTTTVSFKIPDLSSKPKKINIVVSLVPMQKGESHVIIGYDFETPGDYQLRGSSGYTKNLRVEGVQIKAPVLEVTDMGLLSWKNVKNADYYQIFEAGSQNALKDYFGNEIYVLAKDFSVGGTIPFNVGEYIVGYHVLTIRAYSNNKNIEPSDYSNYVEHTW